MISHLPHWPPSFWSLIIINLTRAIKQWEIQFRIQNPEFFSFLQWALFSSSVWSSSLQNPFRIFCDKSRYPFCYFLSFFSNQQTTLSLLYFTVQNLLYSTKAFSQPIPFFFTVWSSNVIRLSDYVIFVQDKIKSAAKCTRLQQHTLSLSILFCFTNNLVPVYFFWSLSFLFHFNLSFHFHNRNLIK